MKSVLNAFIILMPVLVLGLNIYLFNTPLDKMILLVIDSIIALSGSIWISQTVQSQHKNQLKTKSLQEDIARLNLELIGCHNRSMHVLDKIEKLAQGDEPSQNKAPSPRISADPANNPAKLEWCVDCEKHYEKALVSIEKKGAGRHESEIALSFEMAEIYYKIPFLKKFLNSILYRTEDAVNNLISKFDLVSQESSKVINETEASVAEFSSQYKGKEFEDIIRESKDGINKFKQLINKLVNQNKENMEKFHMVDEKLLQIYQALVSVEEISQQNKVISINLSIEASQMGQEGKGIKVIVNEIQKLNQKTNNFIQQIHLIMKSFKEYNEKLLEHLNAESKLIIDNIEETSAQSEKNMETLIRSYESITRLFTNLKNSNLNVNNDMNSIIESLQFQDITRQQLENVIEFLSGIELGIDRQRIEAYYLKEALSNNKASIEKTIRNEFGQKIKVFDEKEILENGNKS